MSLLQLKPSRSVCKNYTHYFSRGLNLIIWGIPLQCLHSVFGKTTPIKPLTKSSGWVGYQKQQSVLKNSSCNKKLSQSNFVSDLTQAEALNSTDLTRSKNHLHKAYID